MHWDVLGMLLMWAAIATVGAVLIGATLVLIVNVFGIGEDEE